MAPLETSRSAASGPLAPTPGTVPLRPLVAAARLADTGFWGEWWTRNRDITVPYGIEALTAAGNVANLLRLVGRSAEPYRGFPFNDSDIYKTLEAIGWLSAAAIDPTLDAYVEEMAALLREAQQPDGYLNSSVQGTPGAAKYADLAHSHELYSAGHLFQAAVADYRATGKTRLLDVATRLADHLVAEFGDNRRTDYDGHPEVETALVELYRTTGTADYLALARQFVETRGARIFDNDTHRRGAEYFQDHLPLRKATEIVGHSVRALYLEAGVVDVATEVGDEELLAMSRTRWEDMVAHKLYLTGGVGSRHKTESFGDPFELPPDRAYCETCAAIASVHWNWRLLLATGESKYADLAERTLFNGFAAGTGVDGRSFFYSNPLQVRANHAAGAEEEQGHRLPWYYCACCPPNVMRMVASLPHYLATESDAGVQIHQYAEADWATSLGGVALAMSTSYPWSGVVSITVTASPESPWRLALRIPAWARSWSITCDGESVNAALEKGYAVIERSWAVGDTVQLSMDMTPVFIEADSRVDAVRGCVAIERGPLVYCLEGVDNPNVDLDMVAIADGAQLRLTPAADWPGVVAIQLDAVQPNGSQEHRQLYRHAEAPVPERGPTQVTAIPYYLWANRRSGPMRVWIPRAH